MKTLSIGKLVAGGLLALGVTFGAAACGSSSKPDSPAIQTNSPASSSTGGSTATTPATTAPSSGGTSY